MNKQESKYFRTAVKMNQALLSLLETKPFEYISISEICKAAGVNRSTFYLHYENTMDLLEETTHYVFKGFLAYFPANQHTVACRFENSCPAELNYMTAEYLHPYLSYIKENRLIFSTALAHASSFGFDHIFQNMFQHIFDPILRRFGYPVEDRTYVMLFYLNGINAIVQEWLKNGCQLPIEEISRIIRECVFGLDRVNTPIL